MMDFIAEMALFGLGFILVPLVLLGLIALGIDRANKAIHKDREQ